MSEEYTVEETTSKTYHVRGYNTAIVTIQEWTKGGRELGFISVLSSFENYTGRWGSLWAPLRECLLTMPYHAFMKDCHPSEGYIADIEKNYTELKRDVLIAEEEGRLCFEDDFDRDQVLEQIDEVLEGGTRRLTEDEYQLLVQGFDFMEKLYSDTYYYDYMPRNFVEHPQCKGFWEEIMPMLRKTWAKELAEERKAA